MNDYLTPEMYQAIQETYCLRLKIESLSEEEKLNFDDLLEEVIYRVLDYCNREDIPARLTKTIVRMMYDLNNYMNPKKGTNVPKTVKVGDTTVELGSAAASSSKLVDAIVLNYVIDLNRFRKPGLFIKETGDKNA
ncbi:hypothetical protein [Culicoidibacter larvae]|uniref:Phage gp6-like head-tail connector protein n=1 Tax=Culicoidibacter larvae TaxID=2579976 RepID=A0A5R8Q7P0_9FIRM|nr:hypothetical protein [Culicoidibacter larvae]TLG71378.1 hypothetical protein FEZ08_10815 [Culicoidibacter larvae]